MSWWEILLVIGAAAFVIAVIAVSFVRRKQGKTSCDCCGGNCSACSACRRASESDARTSENGPHAPESRGHSSGSVK